MDIPIVSNPNIPAPAKVIAAKSEAPKPATPPGWWAIRKLTGTLAGVTRAVDAAAIPDHWKTAIKADLALRCVGDYNAVTVDTHFYVEKGNATLHYTATPSKLTL